MAVSLSWVLIALVVLLLALGFLGVLRDVMTVIFYNSVPLLAGISLVLIAPLCIFGARSLLGNVFLIHTECQMAALTAMSALASTLVIAEYRTIMINADRFEELVLALTQLSKWYPRLSQFLVASNIWLFGLGLFMALFTPVLAWGYSVKSGEEISGFRLMGGLMFGLGIYGLFALFLAIIERRFLSPEKQLTRVNPFHRRVKNPQPVGSPAASTRISRRWLPDLTGYFYTTPLRIRTLRPGHPQLFVATAIMVVAYVAMIISVTRFGEALGDAAFLPTSFFLVFLISALSLVLSALAFFLDLYRVPVMLVVVGYCLVLYNVSQTIPLLDGIVGRNREHVFEVIERPQQAAPAERNSCRLRICDLRGERKKVVVVTAPGGGIHAAAWTAQVLSELDRRYQDFSTSLIGISATSGGSVGTMYFLREFDTQKRKVVPPADRSGAYEQINERAQASCLEAVAWGLGGPDLLRILSPVLAPDWDRGRAMEQRWENLLELKRSKPAERLTLRAWEQAASEGTLPAVAFNATEVETGRRVVFSTARIAASPHLPPKDRPLDVLTDFLQADIDVATAVRLSASFPYVSPAAKPKGSQLADLWHVVDGGYVDNEGIMTAIGWIAELANKDEIEKVIFIRIHHGDAPTTKPVDPKAPDFLHSPFFNAFLGPENAMMQVRATSQLERGQLEIDLIAHANQKKVVTQILKFSIPDEGDLREWTEPPLSWKLSVRQKEQYQKAWKRVAGELAALDGQLIVRK